MAKKWNRLSTILVEAGFDFNPEQAADTLAVLLAVSKRYRNPPIQFLDGGLLRIGEVRVNAKRFAHSFCCSMESRAQLTGLSFQAAAETAANRQIVRDANRAAKMTQRFQRTDWMTAQTIGSIRGSAFYDTSEWRSLRYRILRERGNRCECCGRHPGQGISLHVDHIRPRSTHPELALFPTNLQILCEDCNLGKSNKDDTDWRATAAA